MFGKFLDDVKSGFNNSADIKNPFGSSGGGGGGSLGSMLGDMLGDAVDAVKDVAGAIAPMFESEEAANEDLMNSTPNWLDPKDATSVGLDEKTDRAYPSMTHIRNWVRVELLRREQNFGVHSTRIGEYADRQIMQGSVQDAAFINHNPPPPPSPPAGELDYDDKQPRTAEMFLSDSYVGQTYKGPKAAWARVVSNTIKTVEGKEFQGFVLHGVDNFDDMYGFGKTGEGTDFQRNPGETILGFDCGSKPNKKPQPHILKEHDFTHRPPPNITGIDSEEMGPGKAQRKTTIKFGVHSRAQLDYIDAYFFKPGNTLLVEWGWNTFPRDNLIDIDDIGSPPTYATEPGGSGKKSDAENKLRDINRVRQSDPDRALADLTASDLKDGIDYVVKEGTGLVGIWNSTSLACRQLREGQGNYSFTCGMISNYNYSLREDGGYDCSVEILSMAQFATQLNKSASQAEDAAGKRLDERVLDLENFVNEYLDEIIAGDLDPNDYEGFFEGTDGFTEGGYKTANDSSLKGHGRYFSFGNIGGGASGTENNKQYFSGSPSDGKYITIGYLVDIINAFFVRESEETGASMWSFVVKHKRCTAHPNIKSTDGDVLLIPNGMAPRHNTEQYSGTTIGLGGEGDKIGRDDDPTNEGQSYNDMIEDSVKRKAFISMVEQLNNMGSGSINSLAAAMKKSPRDDLHLLMTLHPELDNDDMADDKYRVDPFPDYKSDPQNQTLGYSGRIQDLFVNMKVVKEAVKNNQTATTILSSVLKRMSTASGGIWDFHLVGEDPASPANTKLTIEDRNFSSNTVDEEARSNKTFIFKAHQKSSIIRSMGVDVSIPGEVAGMVLYGGDKAEGDSAFYARKNEDRILKKAKPPRDDAAGEQDKTKNKQADASIPSEESFIMGIRVFEGAKAVTGEVFTEEKMEKLGESKQGQRAMDFGGEVIDIEFVDPDKNRMKSLLKKDKNPKNCVKYNMALAGIELNLQLDGIEGIRLWDMFSCTGVPTSYYMQGLWRVTSIKHSISGTDWTTDITAQFAPNSNDSFAT